MAQLTEDEVRRWRAHAQGLYGDGSTGGGGASGVTGGVAGRGAGGGRTVLDAVRLSGGLQAQDAKACRLQVWARTRPGPGASAKARSGAPTADDVDAACGADRREVVRTWLMRGTLHAVAAEDVRWLTALLGPRVAGSYRGRRQRLGLDEELCARALPALEKVLAGRPPVTREELVERLAAAGVAVDPKGQAPAHLVLYAAAMGVLCRGPETKADTSTYVLREEWLEDVPDAGPTGDEALAELAVRHATAYGPVTAADLARWSGLPLGQARRGRSAAGDRITEVAGPAGPLLVATGTEPPPPAPDRVRLTGHFDPYLLGYGDRDLLLAPAAASRIATGGGFLMPCVLHDGAVVGTWRHERRGDRLTLRVEPLPTPAPAPPPDLSAALTGETAALARFLGISADWEWARKT